MLGFATGIYAESALKSGIFVEIMRFLVCISRSTQPTDLFSSSRYIIKNRTYAFFHDSLLITHYKNPAKGLRKSYIIKLALQPAIWVIISRFFCNFYNYIMKAI